jgi:hypothetical protein
MNHTNIKIEHLNIGFDDGEPINGILKKFKDNDNVNKLIEDLTNNICLSFEIINSNSKYSHAKELTFLSNNEKKVSQLTRHKIQFIVDDKQITNYSTDKNDCNYIVNINNGNNILIKVYDENMNELYFTIEFYITEQMRITEVN